MKLFWCWTTDHHEDWFVVARSRFHARRLHRDAFGYTSGAVRCERVCKIPRKVVKELEIEPGHAKPELLSVCGAQFISMGARKRPRSKIVRLNGRIYMQGSIMNQLSGVEVEAPTPAPA